MQIFLRGWSTLMNRKEVSAKVGPLASPSSPRDIPTNINIMHLRRIGGIIVVIE